jgi:hypothetical protein
MMAKIDIEGESEPTGEVVGTNDQGVRYRSPRTTLQRCMEQLDQEDSMNLWVENLV